MPTRLPPKLDLSSPAVQAEYIGDAFLAGDPFLVALALKEVGTVQRVPVALDDNPPLSEVLRALRDLKLEVRVLPGP